MRKLATIVLASLLGLSPLGAQNGPAGEPPSGEPSLGAAAARAAPYALKVKTDWEARLLIIRVELDVKKAGLKLPGGRLEAERRVERDLPGLVKDAVFSLPVDSYRSVGDTVIDGSVDVNELLSLALSARRKEAAFDPELSTFIAVYELPLLAASSLYVRHSTPTALPSSMSYRPAKTYTGIVIYARELLPVRGEGVMDRVRPGLFPRIFDSEMGLILDRNAVAPEALRAWGPVGYATELSAQAEARVGEAPLKIIAEAVFGDNRSDLVIARDEALKILGRAENRALVSQGRVLIIIGE